jgi:hypothetical protein
MISSFTIRLKDILRLPVMNRITICILIITPFFCFADSLVQADSSDTIDYYSPANVLKFADYLYDNGDYLRAAGEYQRYLFLSGRNEKADSINYLIAKSFFLGGDYNRCRVYLESLQTKYSDLKWSQDIPLLQAIIKFHQGKYSESLESAYDYAGNNKNLHRLVKAIDYLNLGKYGRAREQACDGSGYSEALGRDADADGDAQTLNRLCDKINRVDTLRFKNRFRAGLYSALMPGLGKIYCDRSADGIYSFIIIGLTAWQAYDGFHDNGVDSAKGWIFGALGTGFYLGNIYGSVIAARLYNQKIHDSFIRGLNFEVNFP